MAAALRTIGVGRAGFRPVARGLYARSLDKLALSNSPGRESLRACGRARRGFRSRLILTLPLAYRGR